MIGNPTQIDLGIKRYWDLIFKHKQDGIQLRFDVFIFFVVIIILWQQQARVQMQNRFCKPKQVYRFLSKS